MAFAVTFTPTLLPSTSPTDLCLDTAPFCAEAIADTSMDQCAVSFCKNCTYTGFCDYSCYICRIRHPSPLPSVPPSPAPTVLPSIQPTANPSLPPTSLPTVPPTLEPSPLPSPIPTPEPTAYPTDACSGATRIRFDLTSGSSSGGWGGMTYAVYYNCGDFSSGSLLYSESNCDTTATITGTMPSGYTAHSSHECFPYASDGSLDNCYLFSLVGTPPSHEATFGLSDTDSATPSIFGGTNRADGDEDIDSTSFCLVGGQFFVVPSPQPTISLLPSPLPTVRPSLPPSPQPTVTPSLLPTGTPTLPPTPAPSVPPTPAPSVNCYPGFYINNNKLCVACNPGKTSNTTLPPWPTECDYCERGYFQQDSGQSSCDKCLVGKYSYDDRTDCAECSAGQYVLNGTGCEVQKFLAPQRMPLLTIFRNVRF